MTLIKRLTASALLLLSLCRIALGEQGVPTPVEAQKKGQRPAYEQPVAVDAGAYPGFRLPYTPEQGERIVFLGNALAERMLSYGHFETLLHGHFAAKEVTFRNLGFPGHTPAFRPEAGQSNPWAFPGGRAFRPEILKHDGAGHYPKPDEWLTILDADTVVAFFGFNESYDGLAGVNNFRAELTAFVKHTQGQAYNGRRAPGIVLVTPIAMEPHPDFLLPDATERNRILAAYAEAVKAVAGKEQVGFIDLFTPTREAFASVSSEAALTVNGIHLGDAGYRRIAPLLFQGLFGVTPATVDDEPLLRQAIAAKTWMWRNDYRMLNGVHAYGRRWRPYGNENYPEEIEKIRQMTGVRDRKIWDIARGTTTSLAVDDSQTRPLTPIQTNLKQANAGRPGKVGSANYLDEKAALATFTLPEGYEVGVFATEHMFPNLQNPAQMQFDNRGRLWVAVSPSYPHYQPGDQLPDDKILIYEDTDGDGRADQETVFADGLHIPFGFELTEGGALIAELPHLVLHTDSDGDGSADLREILLDGLDPHDTHHAASAFESDYGGGIYFCEGRFLHSQIETPYGPQRTTDGGVWRFDPRSWKVERVMQTDLSNPWGVVFDDYGQNFLNDASGGAQWWMLPQSMKVPHGYEIPKLDRFNYEHKVRPTVGSDFVSSRHFPDEVQGDYVYCNTIGFLGIKQFEVLEDGTQIKGKHRQNLIQSTDGNFRPADVEVAPDGSLYLVDWHNMLIGHMQHSARDPLRHNQYGRIYRITYPARPLVQPPTIAGAAVAELFENLKLPELQARKRSHRELRGRDAAEVIAGAEAFAAANASEDRLVLEALWATWGQQQPSEELIGRLLDSSDHRVRAAALRVVRHSLHLLDAPERYLLQGAADPHGRVRMEAISAASWLGGERGASVVLKAATQESDEWVRNALNSAMLLLRPAAEALLASGTFEERAAIRDLDRLLASRLPVRQESESFLTPSLKAKSEEFKKIKDAYLLGEKMYVEDGSCVTCHQADGMGLATIYPPLVNSEWVTGDEYRLMKIILHGLWGKMSVNGEEYDPQKGVPPMTGFGGMYTDGEIAAVATYIRNSWGNRADAVTPEAVAEVREATQEQTGFLDPAVLLEEHPFTDKE